MVVLAASGVLLGFFFVFVACLALYAIWWLVFRMGK